MVRRQKLPKDDVGNHYTWKDLNIGVNVTAYGKVFHFYDCDKFTRVSSPTSNNRISYSSRQEFHVGGAVPHCAFTGRVRRNIIKFIQTKWQPTQRDAMYRSITGDISTIILTIGDTTCICDYLCFQCFHGNYYDSPINAVVQTTVMN